VSDAVNPPFSSGATPAPRAADAPRGWLVLFGVALMVLAADQLTKHFIRARLAIGEVWPSASWPVHLEHVTNTGAAFGILQNQSIFLVFTSLIGLAAIVLYFVYPPFHHPLLRIAFGMQLGGAIGNLLDRIRLGSVTDFIAFPHYPRFNVADSCIVVGVLILAWFLVFRDGERHKHRASDG
jgi:signal peptidase II